MVNQQTGNFCKAIAGSVGEGRIGVVNLVWIGAIGKLRSHIIHITSQGCLN